MSLLVASHNLMDGRRIDALIRDHRAIKSEVGLGVLCIQENRRPDGSQCAPRIAAQLGSAYEYVGDHPRTRLAVVYDGRALSVHSHRICLLPQLTTLTRFERLYTSPAQKFVQLVVFHTRQGATLTVANFHLDVAGGNQHRADQVAAIAEILRAAPHSERLVVCGDTNAFALRRPAQLAALASVIEPLRSLGALDPMIEPTHFFARQGEPQLTHRFAAILGRLGFDAPGRYDVVCTNVATADRGQRTTPDSDHDLVWARLDLAAEPS